MARDYSADLDKLAERLSALQSSLAQSSLAKQTTASAKDASSYIVPHARQLSRQFQHEGASLTKALKRNPTVSTGAVLGVLALGAALGILLTSGGTERD